VGLKRVIHADTLAALQKPFHPVTLVYVNWPTGALRLHSGVGNLSWDGQTWTGFGQVERVLSLPGESGGAAMVEGAITVYGDDTGVNSVHAQAKAARGNAVQVWFGVVTERAGVTIVGEPFDIFTGRIGVVSDKQEWTGNGTQRPVTVALTAGPSQRARGSANHSYEDQIRHYATDTAGRVLRAAVSSMVKTAQRS